MTKLIKRITLFVFVICLMASVAISQDETKSDDSNTKKSETEMKVDESMMKKDENDVKTHDTKAADDQPAGTLTADGLLFGVDYDPGMTMMTYGDLLANAEANNNNTVVVKGIVADVCQAMGCWMTLTDGTITTRATTSHKFLLPKDISGKEVVIVGIFKMTEISESDARHYNEESKNPVDNASIVGPQKVYEIEATGVKILNPAADQN